MPLGGGGLGINVWVENSKKMQNQSSYDNLSYTVPQMMFFYTSLKKELSTITTVLSNWGVYV